MDPSGVPRRKHRKTSDDGPSTNSALSQHEFHDIYLWASSKDTQHFRKMKDCIQSNGWKMTSCFDHKLGELVTQSIENALSKCSHLVCLITEDDCKRDENQQLVTIEMAMQSLPDTTGKGLEGRVIPIYCGISNSSLPPKLRALTGAKIEDDDLEERLQKSINTNIRRKREGMGQNVSGCSESQPEKRRKVNIVSSHPSATKDNDQKQHELDEIRRKLKEKQIRIEKTKELHKVFESKLLAVSNSSSEHLRKINDELQSKFKDKLKDEVNKMILEINEQADEEIRTINEKREKRIKDCKLERETFIKDKESKLLSDSKKISEMFSKKIKDLTAKNQHVINTMKNIESTITRINQHDETLVNEAPQVLASIDENLSLDVHQDVRDCLDRIQSEVERVKFVEGEVGGEYYSRIDGYIGKWELVKSIHIPSVVNNPSVRGFISDDEICVQDEDNNDMYVTNISTQHTQKVIDGDSRVWITSYAPMDSNVIVCGKRRYDCTDDRLDGCITLYDRQWKVIRDISIPRNGVGNAVFVDVDRDGMILAAQSNQSNIYVIDFVNDEIVNTVTMQGKKVRDGIQALSSGDIVVQTGKNEFTVISRSGEEKAVIHCDEWGAPWCRVDKLTDSLYIMHWDKARNTYAVYQVSCDGIIQARRIVEYVKSDRAFYTSPCHVTPPGNLVGCDGDKLLLYKKTFIL